MSLRNTLPTVPAVRRALVTLLAAAAASRPKA